MCSIIVKYFRLLWMKFRERKKNNYIKWSTFLLSFNSYCYLNTIKLYDQKNEIYWQNVFKFNHNERVRSWCRLYTRTIDCIVSIRWLNPECIDRQCLSSEWTDWQLPVRPIGGGFSDDLYENTMPAARARQSPLYKELFNREMHRGMSAWTLYRGAR
jgi:hypothetical protein